MRVLAFITDPDVTAKIPDYYADQSSQTSWFLTMMGVALAVLFSIAAMIGAAITMNAAVANRSREIGTLRALGFSRASVLVSFILEAVFLAVIGGLIGTVLVMVLASARRAYHRSTRCAPDAATQRARHSSASSA